MEHLVKIQDISYDLLAKCTIMSQGAPKMLFASYL